MKKLHSIVLIAIGLGLFSCQNRSASLTKEEVAKMIDSIQEAKFEQLTSWQVERDRVGIYLDKQTTARYLTLTQKIINERDSSFYRLKNGRVGKKEKITIGEHEYLFTAQDTCGKQNARLWFHVSEENNEFPRKQVYFEYSKKQHRGCLVSVLFREAGYGKCLSDSVTVHNEFKSLIKQLCE